MRQRPWFIGTKGVFVCTVLAVVGAWVIACSDGNNYGSLPDQVTTGNDAGGYTTPVVACKDGETRSCGIKLGDHNGVLSCYKGTQYCAGSEWTDCGEGEVINLDSAQMSKSVVHTTALSTVADCQNNPCDPTCMTYNEEPDGGWGEGPGAVPLYTWQSGVLASYPSSLLKKGSKEPCQTATDCQFSQQCTDVATGGSCEHSKCVTGTPLTSTCDSCAQAVCAADNSCCGDNTCSHDICVAGVKLDSTCSACTTKICNTHPECCTTSWSAACTGYAQTMCGACSCASGQTAYGGHCYSVASSTAKWVDARTACTALGKDWDLAHIDSAGENSLIQGAVGSTKDGWVGINDTSDAGSWIWANGDNASYTNWLSEPDNGGGSNQDCVLLSGSTGKWTDEACTDSNRYMCEAPQQTGQTCASGQTYYNGSCYKVVTTSKTWSTQRSACTALGTGWDLAAIQNSAENTFVATLDSGNTDWIGATDSATEGTWVWSSGGSAASYHPWGGQPDAASSSEDCAMLSKTDGLWSDETCSDSHDYVCEGPQLTGCPSGWTALGTKCVQASTTSATRAAAETACVGLGGHLATIASSSENTTVGTLLASGQEYWNGYSDAAVEGTWKWIDGSAAAYTAWLTSSPDGGTGENCAMMLDASGLWDDQDCTKSKRWACETTNNVTSCGSGLVLHNNHCYKFGSGKTWSATRTNCTGLGSNWDVAVINDAAENAWVLSQIGGDTWLGLTDSAHEGTWVWSSGSTASYRNWYTYPDGGATEDCAYIDGATKMWDDDACTASKRYVCELISPVCPPGITSNAGHCYQFGTSKSWTSAQTTCQALGTGYDLGTINDATENTWVKGQTASNVWVGYNDRATEGTWVWANGTSTYTNWRSEPDGGTAANCASFESPEAVWHDDDCTTTKRAICEGPTIAVSPCNSGETSQNGHCYYYGTSGKTWSAAESACEGRGTGWKLATVSDQTENDYVDGLIGTKSVWLGLNDVTTEGTFVWASGESTSYDAWLAQPNDNANEDCGDLHGNTGLWSSEDCTGKRLAVCEGPSSGSNVGAWSQSCVDKVASICNASCGTNGAGTCSPWLPTQTASYCSGKPDLSVSTGCEGNRIPICNHGPVDAPAGVKIAWFDAGSGEFSKCSPDLSKRKDDGTCVSSQPIPSGQCVTITCPGITDNAEIMVNPVGTGHVDECSCLDNWSLYDKDASCGPPECSGGVSQAALRKVNMYVIVDRSSSMSSGGKWDGARTALKNFFQAPSSAGIGIALEFFPLNGGVTGDASGDGCGTDSPTCSTAKCGNPYVPLGTLTTDAAPADAQEAKLIAPLQANWLQNNTPSWTALVGALNWATARQQSVPNETHIVVFVTDGQPSGVCLNGSASNTNTQLAVQSGLAYQTYGVRTYTVGMVGANNTALDAIAAQGGTKQAFVVDGTDPTQVSTQLSSALQAIVGQNVSCDFKLPNQGLFDPDNARVVYTNAAGTSQTLTERNSSGDCGDGWYYDDLLYPTTATLCPNTCTAIKQDSSARVEIHLGCPYFKVPGEFHQTYDGLCPRDQAPQWGFMAYDTTSPPNTSIEFKVRVAPSLDKLKTASFVNVAKIPTDPSSCPFTGPAPCPKDLYSILGGNPSAHYRYLELQANTTPFRSSTPRINDFRITYSCLPNE